MLCHLDFYYIVHSFSHPASAGCCDGSLFFSTFAMGHKRHNYDYSIHPCIHNIQGVWERLGPQATYSYPDQRLAVKGYLAGMSLKLSCLRVPGISMHVPSRSTGLLHGNQINCHTVLIVSTKNLMLLQ